MHAGSKEGVMNPGGIKEYYAGFILYTHTHIYIPFRLYHARTRDEGREWDYGKGSVFVFVDIREWERGGRVR